jgi:hypothetical protein
MEVQTITLTRSSHKPLHLECALRALRASLVVSLFLAGELRLSPFEHRLSVLLVEIDRLLEGLDAA